MPEETSPQSSQDSPPDPSASFGQYQLEEKIAQGGMAEIFKGKALDAQGLERPIVIKRILPHIAANPEFVEMLVDEAKIAVMLSHGNIAQVYDLGKVAEDYFIVMEYVDGKTLSQIMKRLKAQGKHMPLPYAVYLVREIAEALDYMHRKTDDEGRPLHIIHRDISPQNAILSTSGTVKIIDFGIAKAKNKISTTDSGILKGKFAYMSPEHAEGDKLDHRTDIFSLGVIFWELLTNLRLFKSKTNLETVRKVKKTKVPKPSETRPAIPKDLDKIVLKALARDRDKRYASAHDLVLDITRFLVHHYPKFSPRELVDYLNSLFPEIAKVAPSPPDPENQPEITPMMSYQVMQSLDEDKDDTIIANSEILRLKHRESEVFSVEGSEKTDSSISVISPEAFKEPSLSWGEKTTALPFLSRKALSTLLIASLSVFSVLALGWVAWRLTPHLPKLFAKKTSNPASASLPATVAGTSEGDPQRITDSTLVVTSIPPGADIFLNDAETRFKTPHTFEGLKPGSVTVGLHLDQYRFAQQTISLESGETQRIEHLLFLNFGRLEIVSAPAGAQVFIDDKLSGTTPLTLNDLAPETLYSIRLKLEDYEDWTSAAKVFGGKNETVQAALKKKKKIQETLP